MNDQFIREMQGKLIGLRAKLVEISKTGAEAAGVVELDQSRVGRLSRMDAMQAQAMSQASGRRREETLQMIEHALKRIEDDQFGLCRACQEPIAHKRLESDPTALLCIDCASSAEQ
jgi:DnaK suppressor protein